MLGKDGTLRIVGIPIWAALAAFFLLKAALAWAIASYAGKKGYQRWVFFALAFLLDPLAVFVIMLMVPSKADAGKPLRRPPVALIAVLCICAVAFNVIVTAFALSRPAVPDLSNAPCEWVENDSGQYCYFRDVDGPKGEEAEPTMLKGLHKIGEKEFYFADPAHDLILSGSDSPDGALVKDSEYLEILGEEGLVVAATIDSAGHVSKIIVPYVL